MEKDDYMIECTPAYDLVAVRIDIPAQAYVFIAYSYA